MILLKAILFCVLALVAGAYLTLGFENLFGMRTCWAGALAVVISAWFFGWVWNRTAPEK